MASLALPLNQGRYQQVRLLVNMGVSINQRDAATRRTPVMLCCLQAPSPAVLSLLKMLLARGADTTARDRDGRNALGVAITADNAAAARLLLCESQLDLDLNQVDRWGMTPLHLAVQAGNLGIVKMLVTALRRHDVSMDVRDPSGMTPLMTSCKLGRPDMALVLVRFGRASLSMRDNIRFWSAEEWLKGSELAIMRPDIVEITAKAFMLPLSKTVRRLTLKHGTKSSPPPKVEPVVSKKLDEIMSTDYSDLNYIHPKIGSLASTTGNVHVRRPLSSSQPLSVQKHVIDALHPPKMNVKISIPVKVTLKTNSQPFKYNEPPPLRSKSAKVVHFKRENTYTPVQVRSFSSAPVFKENRTNPFHFLESNEKRPSSSQPGFEMLYSLYSVQQSASYRKTAVPPPQLANQEIHEKPIAEEQKNAKQTPQSGKSSSRSARRLTSKKLDNIMQLMMGRKKKPSLLSALSGSKSEGAMGSRWGKLKLGALAQTKSEPLMQDKPREDKAPKGGSSKKADPERKGSIASIETADGASSGASQKAGVSSLLKRIRAKRLESSDSAGSGDAAESASSSTGRAPAGGGGSSGETTGASDTGGGRRTSVVDESITRCESAEPLHHNAPPENE